MPVACMPVAAGLAGETYVVRGIAVSAGQRSLSCVVDKTNLAVALAWKLGNWYRPRDWYFHSALNNSR